VQRIDITQDFSLPVERVYAYLSEHENLGPLFGATVKRVRDGDTSRNGAGSVRELRVGPGPSFDETVVEAVENERVVYRITRGSPLRGHEGVMEFSPTPTGSRLRYTIVFGAVVPGLDKVVKWGLERNIRKGLKQVDARA
jgi:uncharacterized protein YndB with AHSA1/START domain